jgi:hypothetical protein
VNNYIIKKGSNYIGRCIFHKETEDPNSQGLSFTWSPVRGVVHCFWCGKGGVVDHRADKPTKEDVEHWPELIDFGPASHKVWPLGKGVRIVI